MKATLNIFGEISNWSEDFNAEKAMEFFNSNRDADEYEIIINSNGGVVSTGFAIADIIKTQSGSKKVTTVAYSCMSIATIIFLAGDERLVSSNSEFMIHNPWTGIGFGEADDFQQIADDLRRIEDKVVKEYLNYTSKSEDDIRELMKSESFISSDDLVEMGFATAILEPVNIIKLDTYKKAVAYYKDKSTFNMNKIEKRLDALTNTLNKFINPAKALTIALADGRIVEVITDSDKANEGDQVKFEGNSLEDGVYNTAETQEAFTVKGGKIEKIEDVSVEIFTADEVQDFVAKAGEKTIQVLSKKFEAYASIEVVQKMQADHDALVADMKAKLEEAEAKIAEMGQKFETALKEIKASVASDFDLNDNNPINSKIEEKPWKKEMKKIKEKYG